MKNSSGLWRDNMLWHPLTYPMGGVGGGIHNKKQKSWRTGSELCSLCLMISFSLVRCSRACLGEGSWKNSYASRRSSIATHGLPAHLATLGIVAASGICSSSVFWKTENQAANSSFPCLGYWKLSTGHIYYSQDSQCSLQN